MAPHAAESPTFQAKLPDRTSVARENGHRSLPISEPCLSYWHRTTRAFEHLHENEHQPAPAAVKYLIIGSGLSGLVTAWSLEENGVEAQDIAILEAREAISGASGRNAGHVRPDAFRGFAAYARIHGPEQARKIIENEKLVFERVAAFVKKHQVPCDFNPTTTFDVCLTAEFAEYEKQSFEAYQAAGGDVSHVNSFDGEEAKVRTGVRDAVAAYEWPAGSSHPAKLGQFLLSGLIAKGVRLYTHCPATAVTSHSPNGENDSNRWDVQTPRGVVAAENVVHCTNAYSAYLLPELESFVTPNRAQAHSFVPSYSLSGSRALKSTASLRYDLKHFFSFIQRKGDGTVVFGVSRENPEWSQETKNSIITFDDSSYNEEVAATAARTFKKLFPEDSVRTSRHGEGAEHCWTGIIAMTPDSVPMVGAIEGKEGQWINAGHNGHGMARIFSCSPGLAKMILGERWSATGLPECFQYSKARIERAAKQNIKGVW
ncbi:uncharacterized protein MYCFIDRAFT_204818 [Pseudocercospora fijiensis CIRAD86]|uniref:FAD dependent oxidoreductase domain-containing protein n=1 Tax=Pseudocercospora fijiensis (strain CIRAD86) TaxID=383855 RepID=M2YNV3_PSEFD|nr:uncharacterized protein MYCFIDRAFT_204818 [Pseudocercospora fijiensis CIRAD86]EME79425.1 hypothetical protein MYCFIDRAFT_204818 [Pseudocercospora fijiensis CIRAD86]